MSENLHATCLLVGEIGILIRGPSASGKSSLALALLDEVARRGGFARLVSDDRTLVEGRHSRLVARPHPAIAGLIEDRGAGIGPVDSEPACVVRLVVDLVAGPTERLPEPGSVVLAGVPVPAMTLPAGPGSAIVLLRRLRAERFDPVAANRRS